MTPVWHGSSRVLLTGGVIRRSGTEGAESTTAMLVDGDRIAWLGTDAEAMRFRDAAEAIVPLGGRLVTPGFVDAHVHATSTGLTLTGLDLSRAASLADALNAIERACRSGVGPLIGHGWDETAWPERRPPSRVEVDAAAHGRSVYLSRIDVHSALVSSALLQDVPGIDQIAGFDPQGPLSREAHHLVRELALHSVTAARAEGLQQVFRTHAAELGIVAVHEMAGPTISSVDDLRTLIALAADEPGPVVVAYWGESAARGGVERARALGAVGAGGDLFIDGAIGSRTACLRHPYADAPDSTGAQYLDETEVRDHLLACMAAGIQGGFHVIGDAALDTAVNALLAVSETMGADACRAARHRLEHAEMLDARHISALAGLQVTASMQPMFDALWGGHEGMYVQRLGLERAQTMNPFLELHDAGVPLAFGSDAPVTDLGPWPAVQAARDHRTGSGLTAAAAFDAHTVGGWRSVGDHQAGTLTPGAPAHYVVWDTMPTVADPADPGDVAVSDVPPRALRTVVAGRAVFDAGVLA